VVARRHYTARHGQDAVPDSAVPRRASAVPCPGGPFGKLYPEVDKKDKKI